MKQTLKNIWTNKSLNGWLFLEMVLISILSWSLLKVATEAAYKRIATSRTEAADASRMCYGHISTMGDSNGIVSRDDFFNNSLQACNRLREMEGVADATVDFANNYGAYIMQPLNDTTRRVPTEVHRLYPRSRYFSTFGLHSRFHSDEVLKAIADSMIPNHDIIVSASIAKLLWGETNVIGKSLQDIFNNRIYRIIDVVGNDTDERDIFGYDVYISETPENLFWGDIMIGNVTIRLQENVDIDEFLKKCDSETMRKTTSVGRQCVTELRQGIWAKIHDGTDVNMAFKTLSVFIPLLIINIFIGIAGTYWLQIRKRSEEIGIMRSFGATRRRIIRSLIGEGILLTIFANILAYVIILHFSENINGPMHTLYSVDYDNFPLTHFWPHFIIVSLITSLFSCILSSISVSIPAWILTKQSPTVALKE